MSFEVSKSTLKVEFVVIKKIFDLEISYIVDIDIEQPLPLKNYTERSPSTFQTYLVCEMFV